MTMAFFIDSKDLFGLLYEPLPQFLELVSHGVPDQVNGRHESLIATG